jgi:hypothetical protein
MIRKFKAQGEGEEKEGVSIYVLGEGMKTILDQEGEEAIDVTIKDGMGNKIEINSRAGNIGSKITVNGKQVFEAGE